MSPPLPPAPTSRSTPSCTWAEVSGRETSRPPRQASHAHVAAVSGGATHLKICVVGAGAIGGFLGTRLALDRGNQVSALARGATLVALRDHGWRLQESGQTLQAPVALAADEPRALGVQDLVIIAVKSPALRGLAPTLAPLFGPGTVILPAMNGVPWWFGAGVDAIGTRPLESVDPAGAIAAALPV